MAWAGSRVGTPADPPPSSSWPQAPDATQFRLALSQPWPGLPAPLDAVPLPAGLLPQGGVGGERVCQACGMCGDSAISSLIFPWNQCCFPLKQRVYYDVHYRGGLVSRWAWVESRRSHFITCVTLAAPHFLGPCFLICLMGAEIPPGRIVVGHRGDNVP